MKKIVIQNYPLSKVQWGLTYVIATDNNKS